MPQSFTPPNVNNYQVGGFIVSLGGVDLGDIQEISMNPQVDILEHYGRRSGTRILDKIARTRSALRFTLTLDEHAAATYSKFFMGHLAQPGVISVMTDPLSLYTLSVQYLNEAGLIWTYSHTQAQVRPSAAMAFGNGTAWAQFQVEVDPIYDTTQSFPLGSITFS